MPAVAVCVCQSCGATDGRVLVNRHMLTTMPPCSCGGHMQVSRIVYDRRIAQMDVSYGRRAGDVGTDEGPGSSNPD